MSNELPVIDHAGVLPDAEGLPAWVSSDATVGDKGTPYSCSFCGVGDSGFLQSLAAEELELSSDLGDGDSKKRYSGGSSVTERAVRQTIPTAGCVKLKLSMASQRPAFPIHVAPSVLEPDGTRRTISYDEAIERFAELQLAHRGDLGKTLFYACGQIDYFAIFAIQEVYRLLGVRNLTGNAEHCLNAGAVHNEILTGQEGPFLTIDQSVTGPDRFFLLNGWNGLVTHPPVYRALSKREDFDAFLVEVAVTETAIDLAKKLGPERVLLIRPRSDPQLALSVAHELLNVHGGAIETQFIEHFSDTDSFEKFSAFAKRSRFEPRHVAGRIAPEAEYEGRLEDGIRMIARKLADQGTVPINIPSVGLSQSSGVVAHCLWGSALAMLGKYGLNPDGGPAGGTLRVPGQINAESEVQGLSRKYYMGRIPIEQTAEAARRMGLPDDAYRGVVDDEPRAALDYALSTPDSDELFVFMGTQFEANMMDRRRWIAKLKDPRNKIVVIDPIPDPFTLEFADLVIPAPPHIASTKLYQNGEWKMSLSVPGKHAPPETRSDSTIIYDMIAAVARRLAQDETLREAHPDLAGHLASGYLDERFGDGLARMKGEVDRAQLWRRVQDYMAGGRGPLYCSPEHADGRPIEWKELVEEGAVVYGGVGVNRYVLDYDKLEKRPFADIFREPRDFSFFVPTEHDLHIPHGMILNSGRSSMSSDRKAIQFATSSFNSGKATPLVNMPDENPCHVSSMLAAKIGLVEGDRIRVTGRNTGAAIDLPAVITDRVKGETAYVSFHKSRAQIEDGVYVNDVTTSEDRCSYCSQTSVKASQVLFERVPAVSHKPDGLAAPAIISGLRDAGQALDTTRIDTRADLPIWSGQDTPLYVNEIIEETHDVYTFRLQGDPLCRFAFLPGQFCSLVLNIDGKKIVRSYTISSTPTRPYVLEVTIKRVPGGLVSNWLPDNLKVGDRIEVAGPKGKFHLSPGSIPRKVLFLGAGSGITPVMSMSRWLCDVAADVDIQMFNSVRSPDDIIFEREFDYMVERYGMFSSVQISGTRGTRGDWKGLAGHISRPVLEMVSPDMFEREIFMCGPQGFMDAARGILDEMGFDLAKLHSESFGGVRTSTADKAGPLGGGAAEEAGAEAGNFMIEFAGAGVNARTDGRASVLDVAEEHDIDLDYGCRTGSCGDCKAKLISGDVDLTNDEGLEPGERDAGYILTCVAHPKGDCVIDA
ncbi:MAG: FAD-binding oxidoreductase [Alphaproteobacteria bacterium]|nr:FAD-binding oxidoreductase [Alphaproteobacteria bacterium]